MTKGGYFSNKYKNEVGCKDDTMPKTGDTRRHCEVELTVSFLLIFICILRKNKLVHIPMCQSEFGPGTEYGCAVSPLGPLKTTFKESRVCSAC